MIERIITQVIQDFGVVGLLVIGLVITQYLSLRTISKQLGCLKDSVSKINDELTYFVRSKGAL
jgi:hypothetical protein